MSELINFQNIKGHLCIINKDELRVIKNDRFIRKKGIGLYETVYRNVDTKKFSFDVLN